MEYYLPSLAAAVIAFFIIFYLFPKFTPVILAFFAGAAVVYGMYNHYRMFGADYSMMTWVDSARASAPMVMVSSVILFIIFYLLFIGGPGRSSMPTPAYASANTATNPVTAALNAAGVNASRNTYNNSRTNNSYNERAV